MKVAYISLWLVVLFALELWVADQLGIERWTAEQIGEFGRMITEGYSK